MIQKTELNSRRRPREMAAKKVGVLVKEARTAAGLTQEKLAKAAGEKLTAAEVADFKAFFLSVSRLISF